MEDLSTLLPAAALATSLTVSALWLTALWRVTLGRWLRWLMGLCAVAVCLGAAALAVADGPWLKAAATLSLIMPGSMFGIQLISRQKIRPIAVKVGGPILDFTAVDGDGQPFRLSSLVGRPYLLKFYRGHW